MIIVAYCILGHHVFIASGKEQLFFISSFLENASNLAQFDTLIVWN